MGTNNNQENISGRKPSYGFLSQTMYGMGEFFNGGCFVIINAFFAVFLTLIGSGGRWLLDKVGFYDSVATTASESEPESVPDQTTTESTADTTEGTSETSESTEASEA